MGAELIPMAFSTGWGSGINAYLVVLVLGLADRIFGIGQIPDALARTDVLIGAGVLFAGRHTLQGRLHVAGAQEPDEEQAEALAVAELD